VSAAARSKEASRRTWLVVAAAGVVLGAVVVLLLPASWLFRPDEGGGSAHAPAAGSGEESSVRYACPMFCVLLDEKPANEKCPVCGMTLEPVREGQTLGAAERWMAGLVVEPLERRVLERVVRQIGEVDYDETRISTVTSRMAGFLEEVFVDETWGEVSAGDKLAEIYSPALYSAQSDYLVAWERAGRPDRIEETKDDERRAALRATGLRLRNLGIDEQEIAAVRELGTPSRTLALRAPRDGVVIRRRVVENSSVAAGQELYVIADLSRVWILVEVFETERPWIVEGQEVELRTETLPGRVVRGTVGFIDPVFDRDRRTTRLRVEVDNPRLVDTGRRLFQPGQRVDARIRASLGRDGRVVLPGEEPEPVLAAPQSAILRTGLRSVAFFLYRESEGAREYVIDADSLPEEVGYELVELELGPLATDAAGGPADRYYPVLDVVERADDSMGLRRLRPGHVVVTEGNFLLDSQAQLAGKPSLLYPEGSGRAAPGDGADPHAGH
jgi:Cu(I)/Ag(I) efflux system membrane fusion protein